MQTPSQEIHSKLLQLQKLYRERLPDTFLSIEQKVQAVLSNPLDRTILETAFREVHSLAGTAGSYGLQEVTLRAKSLEEPLRTLTGNQELFETLRPHIEARLAFLSGWLEDQAQ